MKSHPSRTAATAIVSSFMFEAGIWGSVAWEENRTAEPSADRTWMVTIATFDCSWPSLARYVNWSWPVKPAAGVALYFEQREGAFLPMLELAELAGIYRGMVGKKNTIPSLLIKGGQHWGQHFAKYAHRKEKMPVACVIGWDPIMGFLAGSPLPAGVCEKRDTLAQAKKEQEAQIQQLPKGEQAAMRDILNQTQKAKK